ncbi:MAG: hypothetical protein MJ240_09750, partial [Kiritimatiellae bacterium]|nr:hypothetical protein [Kiritimatiellia bacterium]
MKSRLICLTVVLAAVLSCGAQTARLFVGDAKTAYRDPAAAWVGDKCHLFFTLVETEADGSVHSYVATATSSDFHSWSPVTKLTPRSDRDYSSPGNLVKDGADWVLCFQSYPRPGNRDDGKVRYADATARLFTMRTRDFAVWTPPELIKVKGPTVPEADMGRMIDPYLIRSPQGGWFCFYKQNGVSCSQSDDLKTWRFLGRREAGENVCVAEEDGHYVMMHSPKNGMQLKTSDDLLSWHDVPGVITLGQKDWSWARGRLTAGFLLDGRAIPGLGKWALFFHGSGPRTEREGDFDRNASIGVAFAPRIADFLDKVAEVPLSTDGASGLAAPVGVQPTSARAALQPYVDRGEIAGAVSMTSVSGKV